MQIEKQAKTKILNDPALTVAYEILRKKVKELEEIDTTTQLLTNLIGSVNYEAEAFRLNKLWVGNSNYPSPKAIRKPIFTAAILQKKMKQLSNLYYDEPFIFCCAFGDTEQAKKIWMAHISRYEHNLGHILFYSYNLAEVNKRQKTMEWLKSINAPSESRCQLLHRAALSEDLELLGRTFSAIKEGMQYNSFTETYDNDHLLGEDAYYAFDELCETLNNTLVDLAETGSSGSLRTIKLIIAHMDDKEDETTLSNRFATAYRYMLRGACISGNLDIIKFIIDHTEPSDRKKLYSYMDSKYPFLTKICRTGNIEAINCILNIINPSTKRIPSIRNTAKKIISEPIAKNNSRSGELEAVEYILNQIPQDERTSNIKQIAFIIAAKDHPYESKLEVIEYALSPMPENERTPLTKQLIIEAISRAISTNNCDAINGMLRVDTEEEIRSLIPKLVVPIVLAYGLNLSVELELPELVLKKSNLTGIHCILDKLRVIEDLKKIITSIINAYPDFTDLYEICSLPELGIDCSNLPKKKPLVEKDLTTYFLARTLQEKKANAEKNAMLKAQERMETETAQKSETMSPLVVAMPGTSGENLRGMFFSTHYSSSESESEEPEAKRMKLDAVGLDF